MVEEESHYILVVVRILLWILRLFCLPGASTIFGGSFRVRIVFGFLCQCFVDLFCAD